METAKRHRISREDLARGGRIAAENRRKRARDERIAELDARYERLVDTVVAYADPGPEARMADQRFRNLAAGRRRRRGLGPLPTAAADLRVQAEERLLAMLHSNASDPTSAAILAEIAEAYELRCARDADRDSLFPLGNDGPRYVAPSERRAA